MNEQEVPEDSSEDISIDNSLNKEDVLPAPTDEKSSDSDPVEKSARVHSKNEGDTDDIGVSISPEELPTMHWSDVYAELAQFEKDQITEESQEQQPLSQQETTTKSGPLEGLEEAMNWLEELAAGQGIPIDEMPTLVTDQPKPDISSRRETESVSTSDPNSRDDGIEMDSDPMAWLEQLAVDQSSPLEELPSVADRLLASEIVSQNEIPPSSTINDPYEIDRALTYLEQLAVAQGIDLSSVSFDANQPVNSLNSALAIIDRLALTGMASKDDVTKAESLDDEESLSYSESGGGEVKEVLSEVDDWSNVSSNMPDNPQQALDWLSTMDREQNSPKVKGVEEGDTLATDDSTPDQETSENIEAGESGDNEPAIGDHVLDEMPEDPDEAIAWMEDLARRDFKETVPKTENLNNEEKQEPSALPEAGSSKSRISADDQEKLTENDLKDMISKFQKIIDDESVTEEDVAMLEVFIESHGESPKLFRLLGDAYMQVGQTDKAIATYRKGFDHF